MKFFSRLARKNLNNAAHRARTINTRYIPAHNFDPVYLGQHQVLDTDRTGSILLGNRYTVDQDQRLPRCCASHEKTSGTTNAAGLGNLYACLCAQQGRKILLLALSDPIRSNYRGVQQGIGL